MPGSPNAIVRKDISVYFAKKTASATINHPGLLESLKDEKFDAAITEPMDMCGYGIISLLRQAIIFPK